MSNLPKISARNYNVSFYHHAEAILEQDFPEFLSTLDDVLDEFRLSVRDLLLPGGGESDMTQGLRRSFSSLGWRKHIFDIRKVIDGREVESTSHEIDHVLNDLKGKIALEIEWNNKDPFFDRDLENFKRLHADGAISVGCIITRGNSLQDNLKPRIRKYLEEKGHQSIEDMAEYSYRPTRPQAERIARSMASKSFADAFSGIFVSDKFGAATTHWDKLMARVSRGVGNPCPLLLIGIPDSLLDAE